MRLVLDKNCSIYITDAFAESDDGTGSTWILHQSISKPYGGTHRSTSVVRVHANMVLLGYD